MAMDRAPTVGYSYYLLRLFDTMARCHPESRFLVLSNAPDREGFAPNLVWLPPKPPGPGRISRFWWEKVRRPALLKKEKVDILISAAGDFHPAGRIPQILAIRNPGKGIPARVAWKASRFLLFSGAALDSLQATTGLAPERMMVLEGACWEGFGPLDTPARQLVKSRYTDGQEFFLCTDGPGPEANRINLLKAFSLFKKRQQCNMKLVITGAGRKGDLEFEKSLATYKYRRDVVVTSWLERTELASLLASAYALVHVPAADGYDAPVREALRSEVPVITSSGCSLRAEAGDALLYADPSSREDIAAQMMRLYKDENLRTALIRQIRQLNPEGDWKRPAGRLWTLMGDVLGMALG